MRRVPDDGPAHGREDHTVQANESPAAGPAGRTARLIALGRDREAAELGAATMRRHDGATVDPNGGTTMGPLEQLDVLGPVLAGVVTNITRDQLDRPTPCAEFTVQGVLDHMVGGATAFAAAFRGAPPPAAPADSLAALPGALTELVTAMHEPGALDRTIQAPFGEVDGTTFARFVVFDGLVHGWDLATATGQPYEPPDALVADVSAFAHGTLDTLRDGHTFTAANDAPPGASPIEQLAAFTGRAVGSRP
jgi:uncharacterized protein (TIGR03086 family)